jgi:hypothetical protein
MRSLKASTKNIFKSEKKLWQVGQDANRAGALTQQPGSAPLVPSQNLALRLDRPIRIYHLWELAFWDVEQDTDSKKLLMAYEKSLD